MVGLVINVCMLFIIRDIVCYIGFRVEKLDLVMCVCFLVWLDTVRCLIVGHSNDIRMICLSCLMAHSLASICSV